MGNKKETEQAREFAKTFGIDTDRDWPFPITIDDIEDRTIVQKLKDDIDTAFVAVNKRVGQLIQKVEKLSKEIKR
tara:strand:+ start:466 stop:690 length:225 start_codon:yes stop_codon:yes gene_type:complete